MVYAWCLLSLGAPVTRQRYVMRLANIRSAATVFLCLGLAVLSPPVAGQRSETADAGVSRERLQRIGQMIDRRIDARDIPGAVALVAVDGHIVYFEARGTISIDSKTPMPKEAIFALASLTKPITATAILMLVEEGRLRLTDPVSQYLPQFKDLKSNRPITLRDLLTHTSGLVTAVRPPTEATATLADLIPRYAVEPLEFQPGTRWACSNTVALDTLARIVEVVSGKTYDRFLRERIFDPLGMKDTAHALDAPQKQRLATRYNVTPGGLQKFERLEAPRYFGGGGGLNSTAQDYFRFAQMLLNKGELEENRLLSPRAVELMASVHIPDTLHGRQPGEGWGLGVRVISDNALRNTWLSKGSFDWTGASGTHFWIDPEKHLVGILMAQAPAVALRPDFETAVMQAAMK